MKKRVLTLFLALALSLGLAVPAAAAGGFTDVDANAYYAQAVDWAVDQKITSGTSPTTFSPDQTCTRAQIATFIWRSRGSPEPGDCKASDVPENAYYTTAVNWLVSLNYRLLENFDNATYYGIFRPNDPCTRLEAVELLHAAYGQSAVKSNFSDVSDSVAVDWAASWGVTAGTSETTFSPNATCTRGQIVTFLYRAALLPVVDLSKMTGTYVLERNPRYEMVVAFNNPKLSIKINDRKFGVNMFSSGLNVYGNRGSIAEHSVFLTAYPDYLFLEMRLEFEYMNDMIGGKYILDSET